MYRITIEKLTPNQDSRYPDKETIYEQQLENLDIPKLVIAINATE